MRYIRNTLDFYVNEDSAITFGKFDGLHRGHELLMGALATQKRLGRRAVVFTFNIPPRSVLSGTEQAVLTTNIEKEYIFKKTGIDDLIECPFTEEVRSMDPEQFIEWIVRALHVRCIVAGKDFCFGHNRQGDYRTLQRFSGKFGYETVIFNKMQEDGRDISSSYIREELLLGHIEKVNALLGYPYFAMGTVVHGKQIGRTIGIPTVNLIPAPQKLLPPNGVYATRVQLEDSTLRGVTNIGTKPTVGADNPIGVETYILDYSGDLYNKEIRIEFLTRLREERRFPSLEALRAQMELDIRSARAMDR